ncbi:MAG: DUF3303 family protein [Bryobacteraceae bacterium]
MKYILVYEIKDGRTSLARFSKWKPGFTFIHHHQSLDGRRGFALVEGDAAAIREATAAYADTITFDAYPVVDIQDGVAAQMRAYAWVDSLK